MKLAVYCISAGRPANVEAMAHHLDGMHATWVVPVGEGDAYRHHGAESVWEVPGRLSEARNAALDQAFDKEAWCVQVDDDLRRVKRVMYDDIAHPVSLTAAVGYLAAELTLRPDAHLAGAAPTDNAYFSRGGPIRDWAFILGSLTVTSPTALRYDTDLTLKEDWDYTCQHLYRYGQVVRCDAILPTFVHYTNKGGAQRYRDDELESGITSALLARWPDLLRPHGRRAHELALRRRSLNLTLH